MAPRFGNFATQTPGISHILKFFAGMPPQRLIPKFAHKTLVQQLGSDPNMHFGAKADLTPDVHKAVVLWPDTFTNYFHPEIGEAAADVLGKLGYSMRLPASSLCCGRPLYDYGFLDQGTQ